MALAVESPLDFYDLRGLLPTTDFGKWVREQRIKKGLTLEEVAEAMGAAHATIQRYETGKRAINFDTALQLADAIGIPRSLATSEWVKANGGEISYSPDPDAAGFMETYERLSDQGKDSARRMMEVLQKLDRGTAIGGRRADEEENESQSGEPEL